MKRALIATTFLIGLAEFAGQARAAVTFSTFVSGPDIFAAEGENSTIAFNYAGNKFVGSVYVGANNLQLYSTDLTGHTVQKFGNPMTNGFSGEVVVGASLGQDGFTKGNIFAGAGNQIYQYSNSGGAPALFGSTDDGSTVRQVFFDPGSTFGGRMLVTTTSGHILAFDGSGSRTLIANVGQDTEGMDIASSKFGPLAGQLIVASEGSGTLRAISPGGAITVLQSAPGTNVSIPVAETVSTVPLTLGSGNPLEGFYVANFPIDIQKAAASDFAGLQGDDIVTSEFGSNSTIWDLHYDPIAGFFDVTSIGTLPGQSEDGIFVTAQRIEHFVPEPTSLVLLGGGLGALGMFARRRKRH